MDNLFEEKHWLGEFFIKKDYEKRFVGEVNYSPENGVVLSYLIAGNDLPDESNVLHGILASGEKCTLVGKFRPQNSGISFHNGLISHKGKAGFTALLIGDFFDEKELLYEINFSLTNMQEFFFPKGYKDLVKYSAKPLFIVNTNYGRIEVGNNASFGPLYNDDVSALIYSRNEKALKDLAKSFQTLEKKHPSAHFMLKKDIAYRIYLYLDKGSTIVDVYEHINNIANLFSILIYCPVYPDSICISKRVDNSRDNPKYPISIDVYPSMALNERTRDLCIKERSNFTMPITNSKIDLASTILEWLRAPKDYSTIVSSIQHETGYRNEHSLHGELILYATQLEAISYASLEKRKKYEYPIDKYGTPKIKDGIIKIFANIGEIYIGRGIGNLRNEITHVGKPKQLLNILSIRDLMNISHRLQMIILGYILERLGLDKSVISEYQNTFTPDL